jgi:hypothetical protein
MHRRRDRERNTEIEMVTKTEITDKNKRDIKRKQYQ